ncbi:hypothetical protein HID58_080597, partial [Brassica napus]
NPYSQSVGYTGLLYSQHESVNDGNSPYESFPSGSSQIPQFSSQQSVAPTPPTDPPMERGRRHKWTPLQKLAILDTLLARTQPLSEAEEAAKNKLLADFRITHGSSQLFTTFTG